MKIRFDIEEGDYQEDAIIPISLNERFLTSISTISSKIPLLILLPSIGLMIGFQIYISGIISICLSIVLIVLSVLFGAHLIGLQISKGLESACLHLEENSSLLKSVESNLTSVFTSPTGIPALDSFYSLTENALSLPEKEILRLKEQFELVLNNIAAAVILYKDETSISFCSSYIEVLTGYSFEELHELKKSDEDILKAIIIEEDWQRFRRARLVSHLGEDSLVRFRIKHKSGLLLWLETRLVPVIELSGEVSSVMSISIDVTDTLNYQRQIEAQNQDLSDFTYMVSHDLKSPIFTIQGMADALREDHAEQIGEDGKNQLHYIIEAAQRLDKLVASVLEYSALTNSDETLEEVPLSETIEQVLSDLSEQLRRSNSKVIIPDQLPIIKAEPIRAYQLFSNIIGNAIKYCSKDRDSCITISSKIDAPNHVLISVQDNGIGIPERKLDDIFRPYRRAHGNDIEGSGIGLACVKKILERIGGTIEVQSKENEGSNFILKLPLAKPKGRNIPLDLERLF